MSVDSILVRTVIVRRHVQGGVGAGGFCRLGQLDRVHGIVRAAAGDHRHPAPRHLNCDLDHPAMFVVGEGRALPGGAARDQSVGPLVDLPFDQVSECRFIDSACRKWSHKRWYRPEKHETFPSLELAGAFSVREFEVRCSAADKDSYGIMSSMRSVGILGTFFLSTMAAASMQQAPSVSLAPAAAQASSQAAVYDINYALSDWRRLRASSGYSFADYARFVNSNPGWPGESGIRRSAERAMRAGENANTVLAFFRSTEPQTGNAWARLAEANLAMG